MKTNLFVMALVGTFLVAPVLALADHNDGHTIEQLQAKIKELSAQIDALRAKIRPISVPPAVEPIRPVVIPPVFDDDRSDDEIIQLNNLRIQSVSGSEFPVVVSAYHDFGVRCLKFQSQNSPSGISFPCPVPPSVLYQIRVDSSTVLLLRNRARAAIADFSIGDRINVYGFMDRDSNAIEALIVRNLDRPAVQQFIQLNNVEVLSPPSSPTPPATLVVIEQHRFPCFDFGEFGRGKGEPFPCPLGTDEVQPGTGTIGGAGGVSMPSLYPLPLQRTYEIRVSSDTQILDGSRTPMSLSAIAVGDTLNIYGTYSRDSHVINAVVIRDLSRPKVSAGILRVTVTSSDLLCMQALGSGREAKTVIFPGFECEILYNATVVINEAGGEEVVARGTTENGFALFENLPAGRYVVLASAAGYKQGSGVIDIRSGGRHNLTLALERLPSQNGNISIESLSELRGAVGRDFRAIFEASGGTINYIWKVTGGNLPPGLALLSPPLPLSVVPCRLNPVTGQSVCPEFKQTTVWLTGVPTQAGTYKFELTATDSVGNRGSETFVATITGADTTNRPPTIHGVSGPVVLKVSETGTWIVKASDPENQPLSYSVIWGDETIAPTAVQSAPREIGIIQDATFTHAYALAGAYTPTFTITDSGGLSAKTGVSVNVGEAVKPAITVISPNGGETWAKGTTQTIKWQDNTPIPTSPPCPVGAVCPAYYAARLYDLKLVQYLPPCGFYSCTTRAAASFTIANGVYGSSYSWSVGTFLNPSGAYDLAPGGTAPDSSYTIQICQTGKTGTGICDSSDSYFKIVSGSTQPPITVLSPNGGEVWQKGTIQLIKWSAPSSMSTVDISVFGYQPPCTTSPCPASPSFLYTIAKQTPNDGVFEWTIRNKIREADIDVPFSDGKYVIRVQRSGTNEFDDSDAPFSIVAGISTCVSCAAPPQGCRYEGASCQSCGTLVCASPLP